MFPRCYDICDSGVRWIQTQTVIISTPSISNTNGTMSSHRRLLGYHDNCNHFQEIDRAIPKPVRGSLSKQNIAKENKSKSTYTSWLRQLIPTRMSTLLSSTPTTGLCLTLLLISSLIAIPAQASKTETCEYDLDLTRNTVKIICEGSPSTVNVYADRAMVQGDERDTVDNYNREVVGMHGKPSNYRTPPQGSGTMPHNNRPEMANPSGALPNPNSKTPGVQKDHQNRKYRYAGSFEEVVWNSTHKLDNAKRSLSTYANSIRNISRQLEEGDSNLTNDMEKLRRTSNSATDLKEGIIAAMINQYNFMRSALLTRNYELERLVSSLKTLVDVTSDGLQSALLAHKMAMDQVAHVNVTLLTVRKMVSNELKRRSKRKNKGGKSKKGRKARIRDECPKQISAIGTGESTAFDAAIGAYMVQSINPNEYRSVFVMKGSGPSDQLMEFDAAIDVDYGLVGRYYALPFFCSGTGHAIYRRHFYCHKASTNMVVKYHLKRMDIVSEMPLPGAGYGNKYPYRSGENTDIDLAVDEYGLWAIYATDISAGKVVITKIDHQKMEVEKTWMTSYPKSHLGNAFMICGVLYATNSHKDTPTYIRYLYNTDTNEETLLERGELPFANSAHLGLTGSGNDQSEIPPSNSVMLSYDFRDSKLYSWNNGQIESFPVYFKEDEDIGL